MGQILTYNIFLIVLEATQIITYSRLKVSRLKVSRLKVA